MNKTELKELWESGDGVFLDGKHSVASFPESRDVVYVNDDLDNMEYETFEEFWNAWGDWQDYEVRG